MTTRRYKRLHVQKRRECGPASDYPCSTPGCSNRATAWAWRKIPGLPVLTEVVEGTPLSFQDSTDSLRPECTMCHTRGDVLLRRGRCSLAEAEDALADLIHRWGDVLLAHRVYRETDARGIERWAVVHIRQRWGIRTRKFHRTGVNGTVAAWLVPVELADSLLEQRKAGTA